MVSQSDYYEILGLPRDCTPEDVKRAFRRLALKYHPDHNKEENATEKFKEINEAYQVLSDPQLRAKYDRFGKAGINGTTGRGFEGFEGFGGLGDIFDAFFGGTSTTRKPRRGRDLEYEISIGFEEAAFGTEAKVTVTRPEFCERCEGNRAEPGTELETCPTCRGTGQVRRAQRIVFGQFTQVGTCSTCNGNGSIVPSHCTGCAGRGVIAVERKISVGVPAGIDSGSRIRLTGEGEPGAVQGPSGDLYVYVAVEPHELFVREGTDIRIGLNLNIADAALGKTIEIPTLDGPYQLQVKAGTQSGDTVRIRGRGVPLLGRESKRGDQLVTINIKTPDKLTSHQRQLLQQLGETFTQDGEGAHTGKPDDRFGVFKRIKDAFAGDGLRN